jgi:hypothetical protein
MSALTPLGGGYTHRDWRTEMAVVATCIAGISRDLDEMAACDAEMQVGRTHRQLVDENRVTGLELLKRIVNVAGNTDDRYLPVYEAIQRAGGQHEVAKVKTYHQHD